MDFFAVGPPGEEAESQSEEFVRPEWFGPPEDELGAVLPCSVMIARSDGAVVALRQITGYSTGMTLDLLAAARGLRESQANHLFHEQHLGSTDEELPDGFLRVGLEFPGGARVSNLPVGRQLWRPDSKPEGPILLPSGGGGGQSGEGRVTMQPGFWLWPLPPPGPLKLFVEWPALGIQLASIDLDGVAIAAAASRSAKLWH